MFDPWNRHRPDSGKGEKRAESGDGGIPVSRVSADCITEAECGKGHSDQCRPEEETDSIEGSENSRAQYFECEGRSTTDENNKVEINVLHNPSRIVSIVSGDNIPLKFGIWRAKSYII